MDFFEWWDSAPCRHANAACGLYGHSMIFGCTGCRMQATFSLHDNKTEFHVSISDGGKTRFDHVDMDDAARFAMRMGRIFMPEQGADPESRTFEKDRARLRELVGLLDRHADLTGGGKLMLVDGAGATQKCSRCGEAGFEEAGCQACGYMAS